MAGPKIISTVPYSFKKAALPRKLKEKKKLDRPSRSPGSYRWEVPFSHGFG
jgi:hypothetical protein